MPPKTQKQKEEEAARLLEEQRLREEEERKKQEELKKYQMSENEVTRLKMPITEYYMSEVHEHADPFNFTLEYLKKILEINNCLNNFREIDLQVLADNVLNNYVFARLQLKLPQEQGQILVNIFFLVYIHASMKFSESLRPQSLGKTKTLELDQKLFMQLLTNHSQDHADYGMKKYFNSTNIAPIIEYFNKGYIAHHQLIIQTISHDQRPLELLVDLDIDQPSHFPSLEDAFYRPIQLEQESTQKLQEYTEQEQVEEPPHIPTDEELLDPVILAAIEQKLLDAQTELETKLEQRKLEMEEKIQGLATAKKGGKK